MTVAYIVLAHTRPEQVVRLVRRLDSPNARFLLHLDKRSGEAIVDEIAGAIRGMENVTFLPRRRCYWGGFGIVRATLTAIEEVLGAQDRIDHAVLLTGQDYPLRSPHVIETFLANAGERAFLDFHAPAGHLLERLERWYWHGEILGRRIRFPNRYTPPTWRRTFPDGLMPYTGLAYWCLPHAALAHIDQFAREHPDFIAFFRRVSIPDEGIFQTILLNSPLRQTIVNDDLRFMEWSNNSPSPRVLTSSDCDVLAASDDLFARKFDVKRDRHILDLLDERIDREESRLGNPGHP